MTARIFLCFICAVSLVTALELIVTPAADLSNPLSIVEQNHVTLHFLFLNCSDGRNLTISIAEGVERTLSYTPVVYNVPCNDTANGSAASAGADLNAKAIGFITLAIEDADTDMLYMDYPLGVIRPERQAKDAIFLYGIITLSIFNTLCFGIGLDLEKVKKYLKKPVAPSIGLICQFVILPLIAFSLTQMIQRHPAQELGIFATGVAPGGGASNVWAYALGGDIDLSICMTFISSLAAVAFIPLWMYTLGQYIINQASNEGGKEIVLPFTDMLLTLTYIVIPIGIGLLINRFLPKVGTVILKLQKIGIVITVLFAVIMGVYANIYAFKLVLFDYQLLLSTMFLPWTGFLFGFLVGLATLKDKSLAITIGIETAVQNTSIATVLLRTSLIQPWADISSATPIVLNLFLPVPFYFIFAGRMIYLKLYKKKSSIESEEEEENDMEKEKEVGSDNPVFVKRADSESPETKEHKLTEL